MDDAKLLPAPTLVFGENWTETESDGSVCSQVLHAQKADKGPGHPESLGDDACKSMVCEELDGEAGESEEEEVDECVSDEITPKLVVDLPGKEGKVELENPTGGWAPCPQQDGQVKEEKAAPLTGQESVLDRRA